MQKDDSNTGKTIEAQDENSILKHISRNSRDNFIFLHLLVDSTKFIYTSNTMKFMDVLSCFYRNYLVL